MLLFNRPPSSRVVKLGKRSARGTIALSYLTEPFVGHPESLARGHTNWQECRAMAEEWLAQGFRVEIVDCRNQRYRPPADTRVAIDICLNLERWEAGLPADCKKILHVTGAHWLTQNRAELARLEGLKNRRGILLTPRRQVSPSYGIESADMAVILGNAFTASTFHYAKKPLLRVPISSAYTFDFSEDKNWDNARKKFLWLGSHGMVHKGLDLVLDAFAENPDIQLTVCGRPEKEPDFFGFYERELTGLPNVRFEGWVDPGSPIFDDIRRTHGFVIYPSCSEGGGGAVIHAMHAGLVPVATQEASVDLGDFGVSIGSGCLEDVETALCVASSFSAEMLAERSRATWNHVRREHTLENFRARYAEFVSGLVEEKEL